MDSTMRILADHVEGNGEALLCAIALQSSSDAYQITTEELARDYKAECLDIGNRLLNTIAGYNCPVRIGGLCESDSTCHKDVLAEMLFEAMKVFNWRHAHSDCPTGEGESACTLHRIFTWSPMLYGRRLAILLQGIRNFAQTALSWSPTLW